MAVAASTAAVVVAVAAARGGRSCGRGEKGVVAVGCIALMDAYVNSR